MALFKRYKVMALAVALFFVIGAVALIAASRPQPDPFQADAITDPPFRSLTYSVQTFLWWDDGSTGMILDWVRMMQFTHIKHTFAWRDIEPRPEVWDFFNSDRIMDAVEEKDLRLIVRLTDAPEWASANPPGDGAVDTPPTDLDAWGRFCETIAGRYAGRVAGYQIWNEPNLSREWGGQPPDAAAYVELLRVCGEAIRRADPDAVLISAGLAPTGQHDDLAHRDDLYLQAMYDHDFQQHIDVVGVHAPGYSEPGYGPDEAERDGRGRWATFRRVEDLRKIMVANGDAGRQMAILEMGYTTDPANPVYSWFAVSEAEQARLMVAAYRYIAEHWRPWVGLVSAIYIAKPYWTPDDEEFWWSFNDPTTGRMRSVFGALVQMEKYCGDVIAPIRSWEETAHVPEHNPCH